MGMRDSRGRFVKRKTVVRVYNEKTRRHGIVKENRNGLYKIRYDGLDFDVWTYPNRVRLV